MKRVLLGLLFIYSCVSLSRAQQSANIVFIGNSITYGALHQNRDVTAPPVQCGLWLSQQEGIDTVYDDQGNLLFYATDFGKTTIEPYSHGFARIGESGGSWTLIDRDGNLLLSDMYVDQYSMPVLTIY